MKGIVSAHAVARMRKAGSSLRLRVIAANVLHQLCKYSVLSIPEGHGVGQGKLSVVCSRAAARFGGKKWFWTYYRLLASECACTVKMRNDAAVGWVSVQLSSEPNVWSWCWIGAGATRIFISGEASKMYPAGREVYCAVMTRFIPSCAQGVVGWGLLRN